MTAIATGTAAAPSTAELRPWLDAVTARYRDVLMEIRLAGSRSGAGWRPDSDWDVIVFLTDEAYADPDAATAAEQAIATDTDLPRPAQGLDLFFVRPDGSLVRWEPCFPDEIEHGLFAGNWPVVNGLAQGPCCDFGRFFREWPDPPLLWERRAA